MVLSVQIFDWRFMSKQTALEMTEEVRRIFDALGGGSGIVKLHAREIENYRGGIAFTVGDDSRGAGAYVSIRPEGQRYIVTVKNLGYGGKANEFSVPLSVVARVIWDELIEEASG